MAADLIAQHLTMETPDLRSMSQPPAMDQDISAILSDFLTYTEHLPSTVVRSLTLIQSLNRKASGLRLHMHDLLTQYTHLPSTPSNAPDPVQLRKDISNAYDQLQRCHRMSTAEAIRLQETVIKDGAKLHVVQGKLKTLPMPPSRDATPEPALTSPQLRRNANAHHAADKRVPQHRTGTAPRVRSRKVMVPGEVLPPPNPDSPPPSDFSASPSPPPASPDESKAAQKSLGRQKTPKPPKMPKERPPKTPRIRPPGVSGTNAHSAVAGISTSNALMALTAPPPDAKPGSKWLPWKRLTEYEMATLRKRMKKNAIWLPSPAMRNRELKNLGRGMSAMEEAKTASETSGEPFIDEYDPATWTDPTRVAITGEEQAETNAMLGPEQSGGDGDDALINRGMRLNEAKKLKREKQKMEEQQALQQQQQQQQPLPPPAPQKDEKKRSQSAQKEKKQEKPSEPKSQSQPKSLEDEPEDEIMVDLEPEPEPEPEPEVTQPVQEPEPEPEVEPLPEPEPELQPAPRAKPESRSKKTTRAKPMEVPEFPIIELPHLEPLLELEPPTRPGPSTRKASRAQSPEVPKVVAPPEPQEAAVAAETAPKKRKRDATPSSMLPTSTETVAVEPSDELSLPRAAPPPKKIKLSVTAPPPPEKSTSSISTRASTANATSSPAVPNPPVVPSPRMSMRPRSQRPSVAPESATATTAVQPAAPPPPAVSRSTRSNPTIHIKPSKAASAEPTNRRASLRRGSNASLPGSTTNMQSPAPGVTESTPAARRRSKRPVPGLITAEEDGSAKVSVGKRKTAPKKKAAPRATPQSTPAPQPKGAASKKESSAPPATEDEAVDPDEPRYCVCGDVSWGTMIACDASDCEKEWFHLECVKLEENPPRRTKWYCPDCRKRLKLGQSTNGIVR